MQLLGRSHRGRSPPLLTQSGLLASRVEETERTAANLWKPSRTAKLAVAKLLKRMIKRIHLDVFWLLFKLKLAFFPNRILHLPTLCVCVCGEERMRFVIVALAARHSDGSSCWCAAYVGLCDRVGGFNRTSSCSGRGLEEFAAFRRIQKEIPYAPATGIPAWYLVTSRESRVCVNLDPTYRVCNLNSLFLSSGQRSREILPGILSALVDTRSSPKFGSWNSAGEFQAKAIIAFARENYRYHVISLSF